MRIYKILKNVVTPWTYINYLNTTKLRIFLPDRWVVSARYRTEFGKKLNLKNPITFNEKLQWLKLYDRNPQYSNLVDKCKVKDIVAHKIGEEHIIPTYGVWDNPDEIDFTSLPDSYVLKTTHDSHSVFIVKSKENMDIEEIRKKLRIRLNNQYFYNWREWPYKNVVPRIIAEKYMAVDESGLTDYKIHCFNGKARFILVCIERYTEKGLQEVFYDMKWNKIPVHRPNSISETIDIEQPLYLDEMAKMAESLSEGIPFVRVDFYIINNKVYFGEMTFFPAGGYKRFIPEEYDTIFGEYLKLNQNRKKHSRRLLSQ